MGLSRSTPLRRTGRLSPVSAKRRAQQPRRAEVRAEVLARDQGCVARTLVPEVRCSSPDPSRPQLEVDEIIGRGRGGDWLDPANCQALCQSHHDYKTDHPAEALARGLSARLPPVDRA